MYKSRFLSLPNKSCFLFGPRGTGKSTLLKNKYPDATYIDFLLAGTYSKYLANPDRLIGVCNALDGEQNIVIIDEVQKIPEILSVVHHIIESNKNISFILTGSSSRKLKQKGVDLLAGRALRKELHPFMASELSDNFEINNALKLGLLPIVLEANEFSLDTLESYLGLYIKDEVKAECIVRNLSAFSNFLEVLSFSNAQQVNVSSIARDCGVSRTSISSYIEILEDLMLVFKLPVFSAREKCKLATSSKLYYFDVGVFQSIRPKGPLDNLAEIDGIALETLVAQNLRAWVSYSDKKLKLYYWRTLNGQEVDFVIYGEDIFIAIEVKRTNKIRKKDLSGLKSFFRIHPESKLVFLYQGDERMVIDNILCIPCHEFLLSLVPSKRFI